MPIKLHCPSTCEDTSGESSPTRSWLGNTLNTLSMRRFRITNCITPGEFSIVNSNTYIDPNA